MRLLLADKKDGFRLISFRPDEAPKYAVLSHTWLPDGQEVTFDDIKNGTGAGKEGYAKLKFCRQRARQDGIEYFWVDTCCIDKSDSSELAEAITSMFRWYACAEKCYVFLSDVTTQKRARNGTDCGWQSQFRASRWHMRGWTLQELLAPRNVEFWSRDHVQLGDKSSLEQELHDITSIPYAALRGDQLTTFEPTSIKAWALGRETTREEDQAYCLMGLFDVSMIPIYGEGKAKAMRRLNVEISRVVLERLQQNEAELQLQRQDSRVSTEVFIRPQELSANALANRRLSRLRSLKPSILNARRNIIQRAHHSTCDWLLELQEYRDWEESDDARQRNSFLWLNGKAGAGKSTMMKFALEHAEARSKAHEVIISFFFNARGEESEKSTLGMWKALLYQLLSDIPDLHDLLDTVCPYPRHGNDILDWTVANLAALFTAVVPRLKERRLKCFIDALDECDEFQIREMLAVFQDAGVDAEDSGVRLKVCFASRPYPNVSIRHAIRLTLQAQQGHSDALAKYVESRLCEGQSPSTASIRERILQKANGVFMWAVLVIPMLNMEFDRGRSFAVEKRLEEIPQQLSEVFRQILRRDQIHMDEMLLCFQWILFAMRPLRLEEFYFAMMSGLGTPASVPAMWHPGVVSAENMRQYVLSSSKGLAEVTGLATFDQRVQFIHESVRDFLLKDGGLHELWPDLGEDLVGIGHDRLRECCTNYLNTDDMPSNPWTLPRTEYPPRFQVQPAPWIFQDPTEPEREQVTLLGYASNHILSHAARSNLSISKEQFLEDFRLEFWYETVNHIDEHSFRRHPESQPYRECPSLLYIFAEHNCSDLIRALCRDGPVIGREEGPHHYPLLAALVKRHREAAQALLDPQKSSTHPWPVWDSEVYRTAERHKHPMFWALDSGQTGAASLLLNARDLQFSTLCYGGRDMLSWAAEVGSRDVVAWIARIGPISKLINKKDESGKRPLFRAVRAGRIRIISVLRSYGADMNATDSKGRTAMHYATHNGTIQALLDNGADLEFKDQDGCTPLLLAAFDQEGFGSMQALLEKGANMNAVNDQGLTALMVAVQNNNKRIVQQLLDGGADTEQKCSSGMTALLRAASYGHTDIARLLLNAGAEIKAEDNRKVTALMKAARVWDVSCLLDLLDRGANSEASDVNGMTALLHAAQRGSKHCVEIFLGMGVDIESSDNNGMTALMHATAWDQWDCVCLFLDKGANIEARDNTGATALLCAAARSHTDLVRMLLERGADVEASDAEGMKALAHAAVRGDAACVRLLLDSGADPSAMNGYGM